MDVFSHGLWGGIGFGRKNRKSFWLAFVCGMLPDLFSFGIYTMTSILGLTGSTSFKNGPPDPSMIPQFVHSLYDVTHSMVTFGVIFFLLWWIFKRPIWEFCAWGLHVLMDIGTHSLSFFPTPYLWPFPHPFVNGIPWSQPIIMIPNVILLLVLYIWFFVIRPRYNKKTTL
jgi:hypothetical protein